MDCETNAKDGIGVDWPVRYDDIKEWYTYVEKFVGVSGRKENLPQLPDSYYLEAMEMTCVEEHMAAEIKKDRKSTRLNSSHVAISYAVLCLKKKKSTPPENTQDHSRRRQRYIL